MVFSEVVTGDETDISLNGDWSGITITGTTGIGTNTLTFALDTPVANGESGSFVYDGTNNIIDGNSNALAAASTVVDNNVAAGYTFANTHELVVDASGEGVLVTDNTLWQTGSFSLELWAELVVNATVHSHLLIKDSGGTFSCILAIDNVNQYYLRVFTNLSNLIRGYGDTTPTNGALSHIVATYNSSTETITMYLNGSGDTLSQDEIGTFAGVPARVGTVTLDIGNSQGGTPGNGNYQTVRVFNQELTSGEVATLYNAGTPVGLNASLQGKCIGEWLLNNTPNADNIGTNGVNQGTVTYQAV